MDSKEIKKVSGLKKPKTEIALTKAVAKSLNTYSKARRGSILGGFLSKWRPVEPQEPKPIVVDGGDVIYVYYVIRGIILMVKKLKMKDPIAPIAVVDDLVKGITEGRCDIKRDKFNDDADRFSIKKDGIWKTDILGADIIINHNSFEK